MKKETLTAEFPSQTKLVEDTIKKAKEVGYAGLTAKDRDILQPHITNLLQKEEGRSGPLYVVTSLKEYNDFF
jgi:hypothetical protein